MPIGSAFSRWIWTSRCLRSRSTSVCRKAGCRITSAKSSSAGSSRSRSASSDTLDTSSREPAPSDAPRSASRSLIWSALRVVVPSSSMLIARLAVPGWANWSAA